MARAVRQNIPAGKISLTYDDYCALPNDGRRYEILEGEFSVTPAPLTWHQEVLRNLVRVLDRYLETHPIGKLLFAPVDVILSRTTVVQPDLVFVRTANYHLVTARAIEGPPDLVVEVLSPSTAETDRVTKAQIYVRSGVLYYWLVDPDGESLQAYERTGEGYQLTVQASSGETFQHPLFPKLSIPLGSIFAR